MKLKLKTLMTTTVIATAMAIPQVVMSDTASDTGAGALSAPVNLDFRVIIPKFLSFRVGTGGAGSIDLIEFDLTGLPVGDDTNVVGSGGDAGAGAVNVVLKSNGGQVTITETNSGSPTGLSNGSGAFIPYSEILTGTSDGNLPAPVLSNGPVGNTSVPVINGAGVTNRTAVWTYTYDNLGTYATGTYGTSVNGGRVTYTASVL
jgi:hypothetical protein